MNDPREAEAKGRGSIEFRGLTLTFTTSYADHPLGFIEAVAAGDDPVIQLRELLGPEQWSRVRSLNLRGSDVNELVKAIDSALGSDAGEDTASSA